MCGATGDMKNMVYLFLKVHTAFIQSLLAQGMLCSVAITDALPCSAIGFVDGGAALIFVVLLPRSFLVLRAVQFICQIWASGVGARTLRFSWHGGRPS